MDMNGYLLLGFGLALLLILYLLLKLRRIREQLSLIKEALEDLKKGNLNRRVLAWENDMTKQICYDINEIAVSSQSRLIQQKQAEQAYKRLMTSLSHDVKTPLASLVGYLEAVENGLVTGQEKEEYIHVACSNAYRLKDFVTALFEWVKLDAGEQIFHFERMDINELTRNIIAEWIPVMESAGLNYDIEIPETEYEISADQNAFTRILNNLLQNVMIHSEADHVMLRTMCEKTILISSHILSEISLLADDIGIIDKGILLEESSMRELEKKNRRYVLLQVSDIPKASLILERQFGLKDYSVQDDHTIRLYDTSLDIAAINKALVVQDVAVIGSGLYNDSLEDYFKKITGGEGIA